MVPQQQNFNASFFQHASTFNPEDVYYCPIQETIPHTLTQPTPLRNEFEFTEVQLTNFPEFSIHDIDDMDITSDTSHLNQYLSFDFTPSLLRQQPEELEKVKCN